MNFNVYDWSVLRDVEVPSGATGQVYMACPICSKNRDKRVGKTLSVSLDKGLWFCHYCRFSGKAPTDKEGEVYLQIVPRDIQPLPPKPTPEESLTAEQKARKMLRDIWMWSRALEHGDPVVTYLDNRGVLPENYWPECIRYHPYLKHFNDDQVVSRHPAMLALVKSASGEAVAIHRTYLAADGMGKADVDTVKKVTPPIYPRATMGGGIRLAEAGEELGVAEGIETALSVIKHTEMPCWAGISAGHMSEMEVPEVVKRVVIWADHDPAGIKAANRLALRLIKKGVEVKKMIPPEPGKDWADMD